MIIKVAILNREIIMHDQPVLMTREDELDQEREHHRHEAQSQTHGVWMETSKLLSRFNE